MSNNSVEAIKGVSNRKYRRILAIHTLENTYPELQKRKCEISLNYGPYGVYVEKNQKQLPGLIYSKPISCEKFIGSRWKGDGAIESVALLLFYSPHERVSAVLSIDFCGDTVELVDLMEDLHYRKITYDEKSSNDLIGSALAECGYSGEKDPLNVGIESHVLVLGNENDQELVLGAEIIQKIIYRANLPLREGFDNIFYPPELNRRPTTIGAVGPLVSFLSGHQEYFENTALLCAVHILNAHAHLREIRSSLFEMLEQLRSLEKENSDYKEKRAHISEMLRKTSEMELFLSFGVEAAQDIHSVMPALRVEEYYSALAGKLKVKERIEYVSGMMSRLKGAADSIMMSVRVSERTRDETRRKSWDAAVGFLSFAAIPIGIIFGFFGMNAVEIDESKSFMDVYHYKVLYMGLGAVYILAISILLFMWIGKRNKQPT